MSLSMMRGLRLSLWLAAAGAIIAARAEAQSSRPALPPGAVVQPLTPDNGAELRRHLMTLSDNPRSLDALIGAGRAALAGGDTQAALTFFSRAGEVAPRDSRVKAGMASVLVRMERGQPALNLFAEAVALGAPAIEIAGDRGLAHDMVGDPRRAQQDYAMVLQRREDPEVRRRLALSLAISGERDAALRVIDGQLRRNDRAAWRAQAFILALTGDAAGANRTAQGLMPPAAAEAMAPFFSRLASLNPSQKAMAAHFGRFPSSGRAAAAVGGGDTRADPGALALATGTQPVRPRTQPADTAPGATRRRPGPGQPAAPRNETRGQPARATQSRTNPAASAARNPSIPPRRTGTDSSATGARRNTDEVQPVRRGPVVTLVPFQTPPSTAGNPPQSEATAVGQPPAIQPSPSVTSSGPVANVSAAASSSLSTSMPSSPSGTIPARVADIGGQTVQAVGVPAADRPPLAEGGTGQVAAPPTGDLADIAAVVATLTEDEARAAREASTPRPSPARVPAQPTARNSVPPPRPAATRARPAHPSRHWVQIAGGANAAALPRELARLRAQAPELANRNAWVTPANATNRLLVGPFATPAEAQDFVNGLARRNIAAFVWTSTAGQEIARLQPGR